MNPLVGLMVLGIIVLHYRGARYGWRNRKAGR